MSCLNKRILFILMGYLTVTIGLTNSALAKDKKTVEDWDQLIDKISDKSPSFIPYKKKAKASLSKSQPVNKERSTPKQPQQPPKPEVKKPAVASKAAANKPIGNTKVIKKESSEDHRVLTEKLYRAVKNGDEQRVRNFISQKGANTNYTDNEGLTLLHIAAGKGNFNVVRLLVSNGARVNVATPKRWTPLHHAARFGHHAICKFLMSKSANPYIKNSDGKTPIQLAKQLNHPDIAHFMTIWAKNH